MLYLQEFIPHEGHDIRLLLIGERVLAMRRVNQLDWRTNISRGATAEPFTPDDSLIELARRAAAAVVLRWPASICCPAETAGSTRSKSTPCPAGKASPRRSDVDVARLVLDFVAEEVNGDISTLYSVPSTQYQLPMSPPSSTFTEP